MKKVIPTIIILISIASCQEPKRDCKSFKNGTYTFTAMIDGKEKTTSFTRTDGIEIDVFENKIDTSTVRWINDCEYVIRKRNPNTKSEEKSIHIKILSTTDNSYTFEYSVVGDRNKSIGTAIKTN